jgi:hypothetical protein
MTARFLGFLTVAATLAAPPALAHHSFAMFDDRNPVTMTGTVGEIDWVNPHIWLRLMVEDEAGGRTVQWALEMGSPGQQQNVGWERDTVKTGDRITVTVHPLKDGSRGGGLIEAVLADGTVLGNGGLQRNERARASRFPGGLPAGIYGEGDEQPAPPGN